MRMREIRPADVRILLGSVFGCVRIAPKGKEPRVHGRIAAESLIVHASAVAIGGRGRADSRRLGRGQVGAGAGADRARGGAGRRRPGDADARAAAALIARAPAALAGLIEARGVGILRLPAVPEAPLALAVDLDRAPAARMPQRATITHLGVGIELISGREVPNLDLLVDHFRAERPRLSRVRQARTLCWARGNEVTEAGRPQAGQHIVIMSGPAGAGRSTAIRALEDLGFEAIDNLPLSFLPRLFAGGRSSGRW